MKKIEKKKKVKKNKRLSTPRIRSGNQSVESAGKRNAGRRAPKWQRFRVAASHRVGSCSKRTRHQQVLFLFFLSFSVCVSSSSTSVIITLTFHFFFLQVFFLFSSLSLPLFLSGQKTKITIIDLVCICCRLHFRVSKIMINIYRILMHQLFDFF